MFPNFVMGIYLPDQAGVHLNIPIAPDQTQQYRVLYSIGDQHYTEEDKKRLCDLWYDVHKQDHAITEMLQAGRASPVTDDGGLMSPYWENSAHEFQNLVLRSVAR
jgi:choline monooxygenase